MLAYILRFEVIHPYHYQPKGCSTGIARDLYWDLQHRRVVIELLYDNGAVDWVVAEEFLNPEHFRLGTELDISS